MKLYLWEGVLTDWTDGVMFAIAESPDHARDLIREKLGYDPSGDLGKDPQELELTEPFAFYLYGGG